MCVLSAGKQELNFWNYKSRAEGLIKDYGLSSPCIFISIPDLRGISIKKISVVEQTVHIVVSPDKLELIFRVMLLFIFDLSPDQPVRT